MNFQSVESMDHVFLLPKLQKIPVNNSRCCCCGCGCQGKCFPYLSNYKQSYYFPPARWYFLCVSVCAAVFADDHLWGKCCLRCMRFLRFSATLLEWAARSVPLDRPPSRTVCCVHNFLRINTWHQCQECISDTKWQNNRVCSQQI